MKILTFLICLAIGLAILVGAVPAPEDGVSAPLNGSVPFPTNMTTTPDNAGPAGYDPSFDYFDYSTVQIWVGKAPQQTVGHLVGADLYTTVWGQLDHYCPDNSQTRWGGVKWGHCDNPSGLGFPARCMYIPPASVIDCYTQIYAVWGEWENDKIRRLLIGAVAGTLEALTKDQPITAHSNCFQLEGRVACNVGDAIRVNMPPTGRDNNEKNFLHIMLKNSGSWYSDYHCCESRYLVDRAIDGLGQEIADSFPQFWGRPFTRDSRCIIDGWKSC